MKRNNYHGYNMEDLHVRKATTALMIELEKERLLNSLGCSCGYDENGEGSESAFKVFLNALSVAQYVMIVVRAVKQCVSALRRK